jgi:hypothetical protein
MATTNDDAVVDCILMAFEAEQADADSMAPGKWRVSDADGLPHECSIPMCANEGDAGSRLLRYCENGHYVHDKCIEYMFRFAPSLDAACCPQDRSRRAIALVLEAMPLSAEDLYKVASPDFIAISAMLEHKFAVTINP